MIAIVILVSLALLFVVYSARTRKESESPSRHATPEELAYAAKRLRQEEEERLRQGDAKNAVAFQKALDEKFLASPTTRRIIDARRLAMMKPTAILVNSARGPMVDEAALIDALENGRLGAAGLDVTDPEPVAADSPLFRMPNVIVTPPYAPSTREASLNVCKIGCENILAVLEGREPVGRVV